VAVGTDTIARFLAEVDGEPAPQHPGKRRSRGRAAVPTTTRTRPTDAPTFAPPATSLPLTPQLLPSTSIPAPVAAAPTERPRTRGPRIADPSNL
jgi:hypothetical protein